MGHDPLDTAIAVLLDQARSFAVQLVAASARPGLTAIGEDPAALAATVEAARAKAQAAELDNLSAKADARVLRARSKRFVESAALWFAELSAALSIGEKSGDEVVVEAVGVVRAARGEDHRTFAAAARALRASVGVLVRKRAVLAGCSTFAGTTADGEGLVAWLDGHEAAVEEVAGRRKRAAKAEDRERLVLLGVLRSVRRTWTSAQRAGARQTTPMPDLDLRICLAAVAQRKGRRTREPEAWGEDPPGSLVPLDLVARDGDLEDTSDDVPQGGVEDTTDDDRCDPPAVVVRAEVRLG